jgi:hypothetical protein
MIASLRVRQPVQQKKKTSDSTNNDIQVGGSSRPSTQSSIQSSDTTTRRTVAGIARGVLFLHYIAFRLPKDPASLRAPASRTATPLHGIGHRFTVTLGRLS